MKLKREYKILLLISLSIFILSLVCAGLIFASVINLSISDPVSAEGKMAFFNSSSEAIYTSKVNEKIVINGSTEPNATIHASIIYYNDLDSYEGGVESRFNMKADKSGNFRIIVNPTKYTEKAYVSIYSDADGKVQSLIKLYIYFSNPLDPTTSDGTLLYNFSSPSNESSASSSGSIELDDYDKGYEHGYLDGWYGDSYNSFSGEFGRGYKYGYEYGSNDHSQDLTPEFEIYGAYTRWEP